MVEMQTEPKRFRQAMRKIYDKPASVTVMTGKWKTGKTNTALYLAQWLRKEGLISEIGANIEIYKTDYHKSRELDESEVKFINNFLKLKMWGFSTLRKKMFIFDEAIKNAPRRSAMTKLNKAWFEVVPEASKMKMHILAITQEEEYMESIFKNPTFSQATWRKPELSPKNPNFRKVVTLKAKDYFDDVLEFYPIPATSLIYDPFLSATMSLEPTTESLIQLPLEVRMVIDFGDGLTTEDLKQKYELPTRKQAIREVRKGIRMIKTSCLVSDHLRWVKSELEVTQT